jgi:enamine deaminase RidA (YjgF/YER057c/UK114 family)
LASIDRRTTDNQDVVTLSRASIREHFVTVTPRGDEPPQSLFERAGRAVGDLNAEVVSVEALGMAATDRASMEVLSRAVDGDVPIGWVENSRTDNLCGLHLWLISGPSLRRLHANGRCVASAWEDGSARYCRAVGLMPAESKIGRDEQTREILRQMGGLLTGEGMTFANVVRTWFCDDDILDWYDRFNAVRNAFFQEQRVFNGLVPASTGVGGRNALAAALITGLVAVEPAAVEPGGLVGVHRGRPA